MQPEKPKKNKEERLLHRLRKKHPVELGMELKGYITDYILEGTKDHKILVATKDEDFLGSAKDVRGALNIIAKYENKLITNYNPAEIQTTYVHSEEEAETKIREEAMPRRFPKASGIEMYGRRFYIVKKKPNGKSSGKIFCLYNWKTRNLIWAHWDKDMLIGFLYSKYKLIEHKDVM
jgi:hypothetical protein